MSNTAAGAQVLSTDVLIVGAGPAGLAMSIGLARCGVRSIAVDRRDGPSPYPRSTVVSTRSMQLFRQWGIDGDVRKGRIEASPMIFFAERVGGEPEEEVSFGIPEEADVGHVSPVGPILCPQDHLEPCLLALATKDGLADVRYSHEMTSFTTLESGVVAEIQQRHADERIRIDARYLVAADGAHSRIRRACGIALSGEGHLSDYWSVLFDSAALAQRVSDRPGGMHVIRGGGPYTASFIRQGATRWTFGLASPRSEHEQNAERATEIIGGAAGAGDIDLSIKRFFSFDLAVAVAERFRQGRVFLVGDAAHRMTPIGGMGANTAIHDTANLAWKLAAVVHGVAEESLLDTYEAERKPVAARNATRSIDIAHYHQFDDLYIDLGYGHVSSAIVLSGGEGEAALDGPLTSSWTPGCLAPHRWLRDRDGIESTIDRFGRRWVVACDDESVPQRVAGRLGDGVDVVLVSTDERLPKLGAKVAAVRPDGVVAWCGDPTTRDLERFLAARSRLGVATDCSHVHRMIGGEK